MPAIGSTATNPAAASSTAHARRTNGAGAVEHSLDDGAALAQTGDLVLAIAGGGRLRPDLSGVVDVTAPATSLGYLYERSPA